MKWFLLFALGGTGALLVGLCIVVLLVRHRLMRIHRVDHTVQTEAPLSWLVDPRTPARHHRRLAKVGRTAGAVADEHRPASRRFRRSAEAPPIVRLADELRAQAVVLDQQLARLAMLAPGARRRPLERLGRSIDDLERAAARLVALNVDVQAPATLAGDDPTILDVTAQIDRLAEAHQALLDLDATVGLAAPPPARSTAQPAATPGEARQTPG